MSSLISTVSADGAYSWTGPSISPFKSLAGGDRSNDGAPELSIFRGKKRERYFEEGRPIKGSIATFFLQRLCVKTHFLQYLNLHCVRILSSL